MRTKRILLDADVIIHFHKGGALPLLPDIYPRRLCLLDVVYKEIYQDPALKAILNEMLDQSKIQQVDMPSDLKIIREYARLNQRLGKGESACLSVARFEEKYIASSNLRDIKKYCKEFSIQFVTTMDILVSAEEKGIMAESDCNQFIAKAIAARSFLPEKTLNAYKEKYTIRRV